MNWSDVLADPSLQHLPYKIELDEWGRIVMSPASNRHGRLQGRLANHLGRFFNEDEVITGCSVATSAGVRVADVAWTSPAFRARRGDETPFSAAPDLCIEIVSPSNSRIMMQEKIGLYLGAGAREVWLVQEDGRVSVYGPDGPRSDSLFGIALPDFGA